MWRDYVEMGDRKEIKPCIPIFRSDGTFSLGPGRYDSRYENLCRLYDIPIILKEDVITYMKMLYASGREFKCT